MGNSYHFPVLENLLSLKVLDFRFSRLATHRDLLTSYKMVLNTTLYVSQGKYIGNGGTKSLKKYMPISVILSYLANIDALNRYP